MEDVNSIWIVTDDTSQISLPDGVKGGNLRDRGWGEETDFDTRDPETKVLVDADKLEKEMSRFLLVVDKVFSSAEKQAQAKSESKSGMQLEEIELTVEINGEGQVKLLGSGVKAGGKGGIKLTFRRKSDL
ncbi:MAG: hypothetical protein H0X31_19495 [Nostocaceae cyanobacterium]|nr:hypothetical protein [Nostocaceae cyanobacterium]